MFLKRFFKKRHPKSREDLKASFNLKYTYFKEVLTSNNEVLEIITDIERKLLSHEVFGMSYVRSKATQAVFQTSRMVKNLNILSNNKYKDLNDAIGKIIDAIKTELANRKEIPTVGWVLPFEDIDKGMVDSVGGKNARIGEIKNRLGLFVPEGFAVTTSACQYFMEYNQLFDEINKRNMDINPNDHRSMDTVSEEIQRLIITAKVPQDLEEAILQAYRKIEEKLGKAPCMALRSSAIGEDSELTFAGQYLSALNVLPRKLISTYKYILASLYTPRAIFYRLNKGIREEDIAMSVGYLEMIESMVSGVIYSVDPSGLRGDNVIINAVRGLGPYAVDGTVNPDIYIVARGNYTVIESKISQKGVQLVSDPKGGLKEISVLHDQQTSPCLLPEEIQSLARCALNLEEHFHGPQDIEWALDQNHRLVILQSRPLRLATYEKTGLTESYRKFSEYPVLIDKGVVAYPGIGYGLAYHVSHERDLIDFPEGAILIARHSSPKFVRAMKKARAIVTDAGGITGHMASLSREFKVPTILDTRVATERIRQGMEVTVDAYSGIVYEGLVKELVRMNKKEEAYMKDTPIYKALGKIASYIVPLHLIDPRDKSFTPENCKSLHDITRYIHEMSFAEMFKISDVLSDREGVAVKLNAALPIDLYIIDLGGGLKSGGEATKVKPDVITSTPFKAFLRGMMHPDIRWHEPRLISSRGLLSTMIHTAIRQPHHERKLGDKSYAIISDKYLNFNSRVGYHFSTIDTYCGYSINKNYINFSFKGGAADDMRRIRRVRFIAAILEKLDFTVEKKEDLVYARIQKYDQATIEERLDMLGRLTLCTRQLDMLMDTESRVAWFVNAFTEGNYNFDPDFKKA
jgi:pyruvate,water dikinase